MGIKDENGTTVITGVGIKIWRLESAISRIELEQIGLKSRGGSVRKFMALEMGLKPSAKAGRCDRGYSSQNLRIHRTLGG
jgi:hypothetical protein